jgi:hypothetical protein
MRYKVLLTDRAESDIDSAFLWFREQRRTVVGATGIDAFSSHGFHR